VATSLLTFVMQAGVANSLLEKVQAEVAERSTGTRSWSVSRS
jgi:hypothetical protein